MSAAIVYHNPGVLPLVWAIGVDLPIVEAGGARLPVAPPAQVEQDLYFYRRYTEAVLRRYLRMSMEAGKVPSLIGQEMFRGKVTSYRVGNFDDVVIFLHDVDRCLARLHPAEQQLISRIALQQYSATETAELVGMKSRTVLRHYGLALDHLTTIFLAARMLERMECCQGDEV
jgi:hypothetical protein